MSIERVVEKAHRIFIIDDHPLVRQGYTAIIEIQQDMEVCGEALGMSDAIKKIKLLKPDLILLDLSLQDGSGMDLLKRIKTFDQNILVLVVSMHDESLYAKRVIEAGGNGYLSKYSNPGELLGAIRQVLSGDISLSAAMRSSILENEVPQSDQKPKGDSLDSLSNREMTVFDLLGRGYTNIDIAGQLHLSIKTVEAHLANMRKKLGVSSLRELIRRALLLQADDKYRFLFDNLAEGVFYQRADRQMVDCNDELLSMLGVSREEFLTNGFSDLKGQMIHEDGTEIPANKTPSLLALDSGESVRNFVAGIYNQKKGVYIWLVINAIPEFRAGETKPYEVFVTLQDISDRKQKEDELKVLSTRDAVTGLFNRRELNKRLADEVKRAERYRHPLSVFMIDIDHFKDFNDTLGHHLGDLVLKKLADLMNNTIREMDFVARYGGDEFMVLLPETPKQRARELAERLFQTITSQSFKMQNGNNVSLQVSIGIATYPDQAVDEADLIVAADRAMYVAKEKGRNQVISV